MCAAARQPASLLACSALAAMFIACSGGPDEDSPASPEATAPPAEAIRTALLDTHPAAAGVVLVDATLPAPGGGAGSAVTIAYTTGEADAEGHALAVYRADGGVWLDLARADTDLPATLADAALGVIDVTPDRVWLSLRGRVAGGSDIIQLWSFNGSALAREAEAVAPKGGAVVLRDLDGDRIPELYEETVGAPLLDPESGVAERSYRLQRWDGTAYALVDYWLLTPEESAASDEVGRAFELVDAGLWVDAVAAMDAAAAVDAANEVVHWDGALIRLTAEGRTGAARESELPLLGFVLAGAYDDAVDLLRGYTPEELFDDPDMWLAGTPAEGRIVEFAQLLIDYADRAIAAPQENAGAYFIGGVGRYLRNADDVVEARAFVRQALELEPYDALYNKSTSFLHSIPAPAAPR
jgi:hypothetical protein